MTGAVLLIAEMQMSNFRERSGAVRLVGSESVSQGTWSFLGTCWEQARRSTYLCSKEVDPSRLDATPFHLGMISFSLWSRWSPLADGRTTLHLLFSLISCVHNYCSGPRLSAPFLCKHGCRGALRKNIFCSLCIVTHVVQHPGESKNG